MGRPVEIRKMSTDDLRAVFLLGSRLLANGAAGPQGAWNEKNCADILSECLETSLVAVEKRDIIGFLIAGLEHRDAGAGTARIILLEAAGNGRVAAAEGLLNAFIDILHREGIGRVSMELGGPDAELLALVEKFGFTESKHVLIMENFLSKRDT